MSNMFFFDSYAVIEIIKGNPNYKPYTNSGILLTKLNIFEIYYSMIRDVGKKEAEKFLEEYYQFVIDFDENTIKEASRFKLQNKKRNLSMADCIGYILSKRTGIRFLTGDKEFENMPNVEFVK
ncbi:MAG: type II toxin-antitoxin system VapC family toxin [Candidatus Woesearchaeota archaeon]